MNVEYLRYALAVERTGAFSAAARDCGVSQPSLSKGVAQLEGALSGKLFERSTRGVTPTPFGEQILPLVAAAQLGLHESFGLVAEHSHASMPGMAAPAVDAGWTWQMVAAHLFVTLLTAFVWWVGRQAGSYVVALLLLVAPPVAPRLRPRPADVRLGASLVHVLVPPGRGPPRVLLPA